MEKLRAAVKNIDIKTLRETIELLATDYREGAGVAFVAALDELETRIPSFCYCAFCESIG